MFLVQKANISSHFRSTTKKSTHIPNRHQLAARSFDEKVIFHLKTLGLTETSSNDSNISLNWLSTAVSFLSTVHTEAEAQISNLKSNADDYQVLYMDYSLKVLDLCNLISSAVNQLTDRRLLMNFSLRLLNFSDKTPSHEKLNKAKDALARSVNNTSDPAKEKGLRAKALIEDITVLLGKLPRGKPDGGRDLDLIRRTFYGLGLLTLFVGSVLVTVMFGEMDLVNLRVPAEFLWSDSVNGVQSQLVDRIKLKKNAVLEVDDVAKQAVVVGDLVHAVVSDCGDNSKVRVPLEAGVKELTVLVKKFSDGVDGLTNGVNGLFDVVLKTRSGCLVGNSEYA